MRSDEAMRQHMRLMRKAVREQPMRDAILQKIREHEEAIERGERTLQGMRQQAAVMQEQAQTIGIDLERRRGALIDLRTLAGLPLDGSQPKQDNSVGRDEQHAG